MSIRNTSGKFSLSNFGFKSDAASPPSRSASGSYAYEETSSPTGPSAFDKLGKRLAHTTLLPALGNKDLRSLQDLITSEKGVLVAAEKMASESQKASVALPAYGSQEGPDLSDVLSHSSTLLNHLSDAFTVFATHQAAMRICYKKIREREEALEETRRRRRRTAQNSESAEKKLAKMGAENKGLPAQTELLERLRTEIRQLDTDIITEEAKLGDYKRQIVKEALSLKFGGLEELGEKLCIIGELGKLLLEEIPLEETPPGYGRAPYNGYDKTENAANEATKCLATVHFEAPAIVPRPPGLPHPTQHAALSTPHLPRGTEAHMTAAEEFANYPEGISSPPAQGGRNYAMDDEVYGGLSHTYEDVPLQSGGTPYEEFGGTRGTNGSGREVFWAGPTEEAVRTPAGDVLPEEENQNYEWEQQRQMDEERAKEAATNNASLRVPWDPLNIRKDRTSPEPVPSSEHPSIPPPGPAPTLAPALPSSPVLHDQRLPSPPPSHTPSAPDSGPDSSGERFHTPMEERPPVPAPLPIPVPAPATARNTDTESAPSPVLNNATGKITAAAFRKAVKPRTSWEVENESPKSATHSSRRLPVPPLHPPNGNGNGVEKGSATADVLADEYHHEGGSDVARVKTDMGEQLNEGAELSPPPQYGDEGSLR